jgi:hypothetical protein
MMLLEAEQTLTRANNIEYFLRRYPFSGTPITKVDHLRISIEIYFNEVYIYRCRLKDMFSNAQNAFGHKVQDFWIMFRHVDKNLKNILRSRNWNVHHRRFEDDDTDMLTLLEILSARDETFRSDLTFACRRVRQKWAKYVHENAHRLNDLHSCACWAIEPYLGAILRDDATEHEGTQHSVRRHQ